MKQEYSYTPLRNMPTLSFFFFFFVTYGIRCLASLFNRKVSTKKYFLHRDVGTEKYFSAIQ